MQFSSYRIMGLHGQGSFPDVIVQEVRNQGSLWWTTLYLRRTHLAERMLSVTIANFVKKDAHRALILCAMELYCLL